MPTFVYKPETLNIWFTAPITRDTQDGGATKSVAMINVYSSMLPVTKAEDAVLNKNKISSNYGATMLYHATDMPSAQNILEHGIDLNKTSRGNDFSRGKGFYVMDDAGRAVDWAKMKGTQSYSDVGAVVAFKISNNLLTEHPNLTLDATHDLDLWKKVVKHYRYGTDDDEVKEQTKDVKFIRGPVARLSSNPQPYDFSQICLCDTDYARRFGSLDNIAYVVFFNTTVRI